MYEYPHYDDGTEMQENDEFYLNTELCILGKIERSDEGYKIYCTTNDDFFIVNFNFLKEHGMSFNKKEDTAEVGNKSFIIKFYFDNKETYSTGISEEIAESIEDFSKYKINFKDIMYIISPEDNSISAINLDKVTHFEIEKID